MPYITVESGTLSDEQKELLIMKCYTKVVTGVANEI